MSAKLLTRYYFVAGKYCPIAEEGQTISFDGYANLIPLQSYLLTGVLIYYEQPQSVANEFYTFLFARHGYLYFSKSGWLPMYSALPMMLSWKSTSIIENEPKFVDANHPYPAKP